MWVTVTLFAFLTLKPTNKIPPVIMSLHVTHAVTSDEPLQSQWFVSSLSLCIIFNSPWKATTSSLSGRYTIFFLSDILV